MSSFATTLLEWHQTISRPLPWKETNDPYAVWLSEILLQQTRVEQGLPYYLKFIERFPTVFDLANASQDEVFKLWEGLGYYARARNLHATAKLVANENNGKFPDTYEGLLQLKGVGPYTAAAIASFCFNLPFAVLDGNVFRVISRIFGIHEPINDTVGKRIFKEKANELLPKESPGVYNQAIMDFGATHCTPKSPKCRSCPFASQCFAYQHQKVHSLPVKLKKIKKKNRYFHFLVLISQDQVFVKKRVEKDIWRGLYAFPIIEMNDLEADVEQLSDHPGFKEILPQDAYTIKNASLPFRQTLTHQKVAALFWEIEIAPTFFPKIPSVIKINRKDLQKFAFPKIVDCYLNDNSLNLRLV